MTVWSRGSSTGIAALAGKDYAGLWWCDRTMAMGWVGAGMLSIDEWRREREDEWVGLASKGEKAKMTNGLAAMDSLEGKDVSHEPLTGDGERLVQVDWWGKGVSARLNRKAFNFISVSFEF
jgi:hypothetical protein